MREIPDGDGAAYTGNHSAVRVLSASNRVVVPSR
jgi:hypothetical protein